MQTSEVLESKLRVYSLGRPFKLFCTLRFTTCTCRSPLNQDSNYRYRVVTPESPIDKMETDFSEEQNRDKTEQNDCSAPSSQVIFASKDSTFE